MAGREWKNVEDGRHFQCVVLKGYEANTKVFAFFRIREFCVEICTISLEF